MSVVGAGIEAVAVLPVGAVAVQVGDVAAGGKGALPRTGEQHRVDHLIVVDLVEDPVHLAVHGDGHGVELGRPVDGDHADVPVPFEPDLSVCGTHTASSLGGAGAAPTAPPAINWLTRLAS